MGREPTRGGVAIAELVRLAVVVLLTAAGFAAGPVVDEALSLEDIENTRLITSIVGALLGYITGGVAGRSVVASVDTAQERLQRVDSAVLISALMGATLGAMLGTVIMLPLMFLPARTITVPVALVTVVTFGYAGGRIGAARGGDLSRFIGVRGRLEVRSPSRGGGTKLVDSSALIDGRLTEVARAGFLEGTLVVPTFVLDEVQGMADVEDTRRRTMARRGLDALKMLQEEGLVAVEISDESVPEHAEVDAKLAALARKRHASLITTDSNLARVAEIGGVRVLNIHGLADSLRPPVIPGDEVRIQIVKNGTEPGQGVGYLADGTMVVVERASASIGDWVDADVTSIMSSRQGRMLFATVAKQEADA